MNQHSAINCPQRSMAWITITKENKVIGATSEMIHLLDLDPTNLYLTDIWQTIESDQSYQTVSTTNSFRTLSVCSHVQQDAHILICTDITDLSHMYNKREKDISITRLTVYGTIEATFKSQGMSQLSVGQPMMRYIHEEDVQKFCAGLNEASKYNMINSFSIRLVTQEDEEYQWSELTVMTIEGGRKILCLIKPSSLTSSPTTNIITKQCRYDNMIRETVTQMQSKFWYAIEHGMNLVAKSIATSLLLLVQTVWQLWHQEDKTWSGLFASSSEYVLRRVVKCTKERPEIETICRLVSFCGISTSTSRSLIDTTLDCTSEWLISKTHCIHDVDAVV